MLVWTLDCRLLVLRKHYKNLFPAANASRLNETVAINTIISDVVAAIVGKLGHGGATILRISCGCTNLLNAGYHMKEGDEHGAPNTLLSDNAKNQVGHHAVHEIV